MRKSEIKKYSNRYNGLFRNFLGKHLNYIYLRGTLGYNFWKKWADDIVPTNLYNRRLLWDCNPKTGYHKPFASSFNSYGRRFYQRHCSRLYYVLQYNEFGIPFKDNLCPYMDAKECKEHFENK